MGLIGIDADAAAGSYEAFVSPHLPVMTWLAARLAPGEQEDIVQEALTSAWRNRAQYNPERGSPRSWLLGIVARQAGRGRRRPEVPVVPERVESGPVDDLLDLRAPLTTLTPRQRLAVDCFYFVGLSPNETAVVMKCSPGTVKSTLSDVRARLRTELEDPKR